VNNGRAVHAIDNLQIVHIAHTVYAVIPSRTLFFAAQSNLYRNDAWRVKVKVFVPAIALYDRLPRQYFRFTAGGPGH